MASSFSKNKIAHPFLRTVVLLFGMAVFVVACSKDRRPEEKANTQIASPTNGALVVIQNSQKPQIKRELTIEEQAVLDMQNFLSDGKELAALRSARNLMDSESVETRSAALETFQWLGKRALPEITEMINDKNSFVSSEAMQAWEMAFGEIEGEHRKASVIEDTLKNLAKQDDINAILMHTSELELRIALPMLSRIIEANKTSVLGECARENYTFITDGEIYETPGKTLEFLKGIQ